MRHMTRQTSNSKSSPSCYIKRKYLGNNLLILFFRSPHTPHFRKVPQPSSYTSVTYQSPTHQVSPEKQSLLRDHLSKRTVTPVKSTIPGQFFKSMILCHIYCLQSFLEIVMHKLEKLVFYSLNYNLM